MTRSAARSAILLSALSIAVLSFGYQADALETAIPTGDPDLLLWLLLAANVIVILVVIAAVAMAPIRLITPIARFGAYAAAMFVLLSLPPIVGHLRFDASHRIPSATPAEAAGSDDIPTVYWERMGILNAYLVPDTVRSSLYPEISPVNTFRLILNYLTEADHELLADRSFFSWSAPSKSPAVAARHHELREVTDLLRSR